MLATSYPVFDQQQSGVIQEARKLVLSNARSIFCTFVRSQQQDDEAAQELMHHDIWGSMQEGTFGFSNNSKGILLIVVSPAYTFETDRHDPCCGILLKRFPEEDGWLLLLLDSRRWWLLVVLVVRRDLVVPACQEMCNPPGGDKNRKNKKISSE
eukprot:scaffold3148_cov95-Cylindrotheca_fusiformis.AAC.2